ncbi:hypothetical protein HPP_0880 [Hydrangea phyllody phytoplasma]|uniref:HAD family hydrolase n=2 Tax=16SrI (Aster yellows group) TaxID=3042590 RepID=A0ABQ5PS67_9MOLU|nr:HAD-IIB family hydrolase [Hydrangea phyllody phytoplasma]GFZ75130.1 hypothetical protein HPP_0880 [Hydrangea phyllody phytoplasma]GLH61297.1 hypothetical protein RHYP_2430 [Rhus yellows phytoplasma]GLH61674.1 hypothetical protein HP2P_0810 [Hydrangea phyllody phytoplasma]
MKQKKESLFIFDIDGTLLSSKYKKIFPQTIKAIQTLAQNPDNVLAVATGRNIKRIDVLGNLLPYFKHFVFFNGGLTKYFDKVIDDRPFKKEVVKELIAKAHQAKIHIGLTGMTQEIVPSPQDLIPPSLGELYCTNKKSVVDPEFHLHNNVYQVWLFEPNKEKLQNFLKDLKDLQAYYWRTNGGVDLVPQSVNKTCGIKKLKEFYPHHQLVCVGDGYNDVEMLKLADVGIGLENTNCQEIKDNCNLLAPHIDDDKFYDFLKLHHLV